MVYGCSVFAFLHSPKIRHRILIHYDFMYCVFSAGAIPESVDMSCFFALFPNRIMRFPRHFYLEMLSLGEQPFQVASETERSDHHPNEPIIFPVHLIRNHVFRFLRRPLNPLIFLAFLAFLPSAAVRFLRVFYGLGSRIFHETIQVVSVTSVTHSFSTDSGGFSLQMTRNQVYLTVPWVRIPHSPPKKPVLRRVSAF